LDKDKDPFERLNARIALGVMPLLNGISYRARALTVLAWCQLLFMVIAIGLLAAVLGRVI